MGKPYFTARHKEGVMLWGWQAVQKKRAIFTNDLE